MDGFKYEIKDNVLIIKECPNNSLNRNLIRSIQNKNFTSIHICEGIERINRETFKNMDIEYITLPNSLKKIGNYAFCNCAKLKEIIIPDTVTELGECAFQQCHNLKIIKLSNKLKEIKKNTFLQCSNLEEIIIPDSVTIIGDSTFAYCFKLNKVKLSSNLKHIGNYTFYNCDHIEEIILPEKIEIIGEYAFDRCEAIKEITIPEGITELNKTFVFCTNLKKVRLPNSLKRINRAFAYCSSLEEIEIPDNVVKIDESTFKECYCLKQVKLPSSLKIIEKKLFEECTNLEKVEIPEGVTEISKMVFYKCRYLSEIHLPTTLKKIDDQAIYECPSFTNLILNTENKSINLYIPNSDFIQNTEKALFLFDRIKERFYLYANGKYDEFEPSFFENHPMIRKLFINDDLSWGYDLHYFVKIYYWAQKKYIPSHIVMKNMPLIDIDNFYMNNNGKEWSKLIEASNISKETNKASFFKLCYVLGVFSTKASFRDKAIKFIKENIINKCDEEYIHRKFDRFNVDNGFNEEYAEFFMKYYDGENFMKMEYEDGSEVDLMAASYNQFKNVKKMYPSKTVNTNRRADILLPEHVMKAISCVSYENIDYGNEELANLAGKYGYSEEEFQKLQTWYNFGKSIREMKLFISEDNVEKGITYKLLNKDDPICSVLGNITNCCQVIGGAGESCVEYGMTKPNSSFLTFNYKGKIIGQAWVWYDKFRKTICLDNIEIPERYSDEIRHNKDIQDNFIMCLLRIKDNFINEMNKKGFKVERVTIGKGYNDLKEMLEKIFKLVDNPRKLMGYTGYSDASIQYEIVIADKMIPTKR